MEFRNDLTKILFISAAIAYVSFRSTTLQNLRLGRNEIKNESVA